MSAAEGIGTTAPMVQDSAAGPGAVACVGDWRSRGKAISITAKDGELLLEMGASAPVLGLIAATEGGGEIWPMVWKAVWRPAPGEAPREKEPLYILELPTPTSPKLFVKRPIGDGTVEFVRAGSDVVPIAASKDTAQEDRSRSRARRRSPSSSQSRSRSGSASTRKGGVGHFLPGDWNCPKCGDHQFARNLTCRNCSTAKPNSGKVHDKPTKQADPVGREGLVMQIKRGQRESVGFKERWWEYCDKHGNGFYDPNRHDLRFLEDFVEREREGGHPLPKPPTRGRSRSASRGSRSSAGSNSSRSSARSRSTRGKEKGRKRRKRSQGRRKRRRRRKERRGKSRGHRKRKDKKRKAKPSKSKAKASKSRSRSLSKSASKSLSRSPSRPSRSSSSASSISGLPSRDAAVQAAKKAVKEAEKDLAKAQEHFASGPGIDEAVRVATEAKQAEIKRLVELAQKQAEETLQAKLREHENKMQDDKMSKLREAEERLDKAIAVRMAEAEKRLRREAEEKVEEIKALAAEGVSEAIAETERRCRADAAEKVKAAEEVLQQAKDRLASMGKEGDSAKKASASRRRSSSASSYASRSHSK